jgi:hypothetical protein
MRIVVTGATGNVGSQLLPQLLSTVLPGGGTPSVVGIARRLPAEPDPRVEWHALDIAADDLAPAVRGADVVVHLAWLLQPSHDPDEMRRVNLLGSRRVFDAVVREGVPALVHASSIGAYSRAPKDRRVDESHPTEGFQLDVQPAQGRGRAHARPARGRAPRASRGAAAHGHRPAARRRQRPRAYFLGPFVPQSLVRRVAAAGGARRRPAGRPGAARRGRRERLRPRLHHAGAGRLQPRRGAGARPPDAGRLLGARTVPVPAAVLRGVVDLSWRLHVQPTDPGLGRHRPLRTADGHLAATSVLGWTPQHDAGEALVATVDAMGAGHGAATPVLRPRAGGLGRAAEVVRGLVPGLR